MVVGDLGKIFVDKMYICRLDSLFLVLTVSLMSEEVPKGDEIYN